MLKHLAPAAGEIRTVLTAPNRWVGASLSHLVIGPTERLEYCALQPRVAVYVGQPVLLSGGIGGAVRPRFHIQRDRVNIVPRGAHVWGAWDAPTEWICLSFDPSRLAGVHGGSAMDLVPSSASHIPLLAQLACALRDDAACESPEGSTYGEGLLAAVLAYVHRWHSRRKVRARTGGSLSGAALQRVIDRMQDMESAATLSELAALVGMDQYGFLRRFKKATGRTPHQFLIRSRMERAVGLLRGTALPITEIALRCGFSSASHFAETFRKGHGMTALQYRSAMNR